MSPQPTYPTFSSRRLAAIAIGVTTAIELAALSHHPVGAQVASARAGLEHLIAQQGMAQAVHGALIVLLASLTTAFAVFGGVLGARRPAVMLAMTAYGLGAGCMLGAMLFDGFVAPQLVRKLVAAAANDVDVVQLILPTIGTIIQVCAKAGLLFMSVALLAWSYALATSAHLPHLPRWSRYCALAGVAAALVPALVILFAEVALAPANLLAIFGLHGVWNLAVAAILFSAGAADGSAASLGENLRQQTA